MNGTQMLHEKYSRKNFCAHNFAGSAVNVVTEQVHAPQNGIGNNMPRALFLPAVLLATLATPVLAANVKIQLVIELEGEAQRNLLHYKCDAATDLVEVEYLNADPNFLAIMTVDGKKLVFASAFSESGVRYVSGRYAWWTKGADASLFDEANGPDADPLVTCIEVNNTP